MCGSTVGGCPACTANDSGSVVQSGGVWQHSGRVSCVNGRTVVAVQRVDVWQYSVWVSEGVGSLTHTRTHTYTHTHAHTRTHTLTSCKKAHHFAKSARNGAPCSAAVAMSALLACACLLLAPNDSCPLLVPLSVPHTRAHAATTLLAPPALPPAAAAECWSWQSLMSC